MLLRVFFIGTFHSCGWDVCTPYRFLFLFLFYFRPCLACGFSMPCYIALWLVSHSEHSVCFNTSHRILNCPCFAHSLLPLVMLNMSNTHDRLVCTRTFDQSPIETRCRMLAPRW